MSRLKALIFDLKIVLYIIQFIDFGQSMQLLANGFVQPIWFTIEKLVHIRGNFSCALTAHAEKKKFFWITARGSAEQIIASCTNYNNFFLILDQLQNTEGSLSE